LKLIQQDVLKIQTANDVDNVVDDDNDGIPDVQQIPTQDLVKRKIHLVLTTIDPMSVMDACSGVMSGFMAVIATLRIEFAQTITIGLTIGGMIQRALQQFVEPVLIMVIPPMYSKWIPVLVIYGSRTFGISIAWLVQRCISAFYSSLRGADLFANGALKYAARMGYTAPFDNTSQLFSVVVMVIATLGFLWQIFSGFSLPFPLNLFFLPLTLVEWFLTWVIAVQH